MRRIVGRQAAWEQGFRAYGYTDGHFQPVRQAAHDRSRPLVSMTYPRHLALVTATTTE
jgi:hypothetical protein